VSDGDALPAQRSGSGALHVAVPRALSEKDLLVKSSTCRNANDSRSHWQQKRPERMVGMAAKFEVRKNGTGEFRFVLVSQGRVLATSEPYGRKVSCLNAIESLRKAAGTAPVADNTIPPANGASAPAAKQPQRPSRPTTVRKVATKTAAPATKVDKTKPARPKTAAKEKKSAAKPEASPKTTKRTARAV
jgi:uncharacterized protein YegP (UPF0339 family)